MRQNKIVLFMKGEKNAPGSATILLPRKGGPAIPTAFGCPKERVAWAFAEWPR